MSAYFVNLQAYPSPLSSTPPYSRDMIFDSSAIHPLTFIFANAVISAWNTNFPTAFNCYFFQEEFPDHSRLRYSAPMYFLYQDTYHTLFHNCQFIYPYFLLDYTYHEDSGCVSLIHPVSSAIAQCLAQTGICLMNTAVGIPSTSDRVYQEWRCRRVRMRKEARKEARKEELEEGLVSMVSKKEVLGADCQKWRCLI